MNGHCCAASYTLYIPSTFSRPHKTWNIENKEYRAQQVSVKCNILGYSGQSLPVIRFFDNK